MATYYVEKGASHEPWSECTNIATPGGYDQANTNAVAGDILVFLNTGGDYTVHETINPTNNGSAEQPITYRGQTGQTVSLMVIGNPIALEGNSYITVENFTISGASYQVSMQNHLEPFGTSSNIVIQNNIFIHRDSGSITAMIVGYGNCNNISILNNTFHGPVADEAGMSNGDLIYFSATEGYSQHHIRIEGNTFYGGNHSCIDIQANGTDDSNYHVIKNNTINNPNHTGLIFYSGVSNSLIEGNTIFGSGSICGLTNCNANTYGSGSDKANGLWLHYNMQLGGSNNIIRKNVFYDGGGGLSIGGVTQNNRIYSNTMYKNVKAVMALDEGYDVSGNVFRNNAFIENDREGYNGSQPLSNNFPMVIQLQSSTNYLNEWAYNNFYDTEKIQYRTPAVNYTDKTVAEIEALIPAQFHDNLSSDPGFADEMGRNFRITSRSLMKNAGGALTLTDGAGENSNLVTVIDARYFTDGLGIIDGDIIKIEGVNGLLEITDIDYDTNIITIDQNITWETGRAVNLYYFGSAPDIGAVEYTNDLNLKGPERLGHCSTNYAYQGND